MRIQNGDIYRANHRRLMRYHLVLAAINLALGTAAAFLLGPDRPGLLLIPVFAALLHGLLAYGSHRRAELARKASVVLFVLLAIGTTPIGTLIVLFVLLPATQWQTPPD